MTLPWIESQIEETLAAANTPKNVYDLAMLLICRDEMRKRAAESEATPSEDDSKRQAIVLTSHSADLDTTPTLEQIEDALGAVPIHNRAQQKRARDARTWAQIIAENKNP